MLTEDLDSPRELTAADLTDRYESALADVVAAVGPDEVEAEAGIDPTIVSSIERGHSEDIALDDAAAVLSLDAGEPDADTIIEEARDHLLLLMSSAMLGVESLARELGDGIEPGELQAKLEGRLPMTVGEYARLHHFLAVRTVR